MDFNNKKSFFIGFIICGTQKGGTTALDYYLRFHEEVCMAKKKEVHFFDNDDYFKRKKIKYQDYHKFFNPSKNHKIIGEATPIYMFWENAMERIYDYNPDMKLIAILRNPIDRAFSNWNMEKQRKRETRTFLDSIKYEIENIKKAHIYDGIALTKYLFWLKKNFYKKNITEITASKKLLKFRKKNKKFKFLSFPTISGTGPNGAIIHYKATRKTDRKLKKGDIYLVDSGGQYEFGTTDVTRTISLKNYNKRIKDIFTRVLKGHIAVSNFKLKKNSRVN